MTEQGELPLGGRPRSRKLGPDSPIPDKLYFKIGEVSLLVGVRAHVLRYWEKEVPAIRPGKSASNQRRYRYKDVEIFREIRRLLHEERYTLAGARKRIMSGTGEPDTVDAAAQMDAEPMRELAPETNAASLTGDDVRLDKPIFQAPQQTPKIDADPRLPLRFSGGASPHDKVEKVRAGLRDLIRFCGEEF